MKGYKSDVFSHATNQVVHGETQNKIITKSDRPFHTRCVSKTASLDMIKNLNPALEGKYLPTAFVLLCFLFSGGEDFILKIEKKTRLKADETFSRENFKT